MTELGQTNDPRVLIPGHLATVEADAAALGDHGRRLADVAQRLREVRVDGWGGRAGPRFAESWSRQPPAWFHLADALHRAHTALTGYLDMLDWAQDEAAAAIELWNRGREKTEESSEAGSRSGYQVEIEDKRVSRPQAVGIETPADPGVALRADARERLDDARTQLRAAGDALAEELLTAFGGPGRLEALLAPLHLVDGAGHHSGTTPDGRGFVTGQYTGGPDVDGRLTSPDPATGGLGGYDGHARPAQGSFNGGYTDGDLGVRGQGRAFVGTEVSAAASNAPDGFAANAELAAGAKATAEADVRYGAFAAHSRAKAEAGAFASGSLDTGQDHLKLAGDAFVGARAGIEQSVEAGGITVGGRAEAMAGVGGTADLDLDLRDGKIHLGGHAGGALGVGGTVGGSITIDPEEVAQTAREAADSVGRGVREVDDTGSRLGSAVNPFG